MTEYSVIGKSVPRVDALAKVMGKASFATDFKVPGMCHAKLLRSPYPHARILRIDTSKAKKLPGVKAVVTEKDTPDMLWGMVTRDRPVIARGVVRFVGEPVAGVIADTIEAAEEALECIDVDYEELPAIFDAEEAMVKNPPVVLHPDLFNYERIPKDPVLYGLDHDTPNVFRHKVILNGDVEKGFQEADLVVENRYYCPKTAHAPVGPHAAIAWWEADGSLVVLSSTQRIHWAKAQLARYFSLPLAKVKVRTEYMGGGFGGNSPDEISPIVAVMAKKSRCPVRLEYSRAEQFINTTRPNSITYVKDGVKKDGTLIARQVKFIIDAGAYAECGPDRHVVSAAFGAIGTYRIPNLRIDCYGVYTNNTRSSAFRGVESPRLVFAIEQQMDILAEKLGLDPVEFRKKNFLQEGEVDASGMVTHSIGVKQCLEKTAAQIEWGKKPADNAGASPWKKGIGIAVGNQYTIGAAFCSIVKVHPDGFVEVRVGNQELGQGVTTVVAQIAAEEFGLPIDRIRVTHGDTDITPMVPWTGASSATFFTGGALVRACQDAKRQLCELAAPMLRVNPEELEIKAGSIQVKKAPEKSIAISAVFQQPLGWAPGVGEVLGRAEFDIPIIPQDPKTGKSERFAVTYGHGAYGVEVAANTETGEVKITRIAGTFDMGQPINPKMCEQQIEGGAAMGVGHAIFEEQIMVRGVLKNPNYRDYMIPTFMEMPRVGSFDSMIAAAPHKEGPYGAKGLGEVVLAPMPAAVCNAVYNAIGVRINDLPMSAEKVLKALKEKKATRDKA